jgi:hypothetical protein
MAITSRPPTCTALVCSQAPRTWSSTSALTRANARRKLDSSAGPRAAPSPASTAGPASAAHWPIAANDFEPAITAAIPTASSPASECRRPRLFRGSGTWARRSSRYWLRAAGIGEDVIGVLGSLAAEDGERRNSIVPSGPGPPLADTPGTSPAVTNPQVTVSIHDFAVSLRSSSLRRDQHIDNTNKVALHGGTTGAMSVKVQLPVRCGRAGLSHLAGDNDLGCG